MNEFKTSLHAVNLALRTVRIADAVKKTAIVSAVCVCCFMLYRGIKEKAR